MYFLKVWQDKNQIKNKEEYVTEFLHAFSHMHAILKFLQSARCFTAYYIVGAQQTYVKHIVEYSSPYSNISFHDTTKSNIFQACSLSYENVAKQVKTRETYMSLPWQKSQV